MMIQKRSAMFGEPGPPPQLPSDIDWLSLDLNKGAEVQVKYEFEVTLQSNVTDLHEGGTIGNVTITFVHDGPGKTISCARVRVMVDSEIGDIVDFESSRVAMVEADDVVKHGKAGLVSLLGRLQWKRLRDGDRIEIVQTNGGHVNRQVVGSELSWTHMQFEETILVQESMNITLHNAETGEVVEKHAWPDTTSLTATAGDLEAAFALLYQGSVAPHPFEAFRNYYLVVEHLAGQERGDHLDLVENWLRSHGVTDVAGQTVDRSLLRALYKGGRCALNHAKRDFKVPTDPDDEAAIRKDLPIIKSLARACIDAASRQTS